MASIAEPIPVVTAPPLAPVMEAVGLVREYGPVVAVDGIDLSLGPGEFLVVFGPNGAGKSSLLGMLGGGMRPTKGEVRIHGAPLDPGDLSWRSRVGLLSHRGFFYQQLTVEENLRFYGKLYGLADLEGRISERLARVGLGERARFQVRQLSHGMRQRLALARCLLHDPEVVLLDEPFTGLDRPSSDRLVARLSKLRERGRTLVLVTHDVALAVRLADVAIVLRRGEVVHRDASGRLDANALEHAYASDSDGTAA